MKLRAELLNQTRSQTLKLQREIKGVQTKIDNLVNAVSEGILPKEIVKDKLQKLREDKQRLELELNQGRVVAFPKISVTKQFIQNFRDICKDVILTGDIKKRQTFIKNFVKKIDLTRTSCKVTYDLAHLLITQEDGSTLKDNMVEAAGIEPAFFFVTCTNLKRNFQEISSGIRLRPFLNRDSPKKPG